VRRPAIPRAGAPTAPEYWSNVEDFGFLLPWQGSRRLSKRFHSVGANYSLNPPALSLLSAREVRNSTKISYACRPTRASAAPKFASTPRGSSASIPVRRIGEHRRARKHLPADWRALRSEREPTPLAFCFTNDICPRAALWILDAQTTLGVEAVSAQRYSYFLSQGDSPQFLSAAPSRRMQLSPKSEIYWSSADSCAPKHSAADPAR
jgi:hypothetical protein